MGNINYDEQTYYLFCGNLKKACNLEENENKEKNKLFGCALDCQRRNPKEIVFLPEENANYTSNELREIADKLDELNNNHP